MPNVLINQDDSLAVVIQVSKEMDTTAALSELLKLVKLLDARRTLSALTPNVIAYKVSESKTITIILTGFKFLLGYVGEGNNCVADKDMPCDVVNNCSPYAVCSFSQEINEYECRCQEGYQGNGYICEKSSENELETTEKPEKDKVNERCLLGVCWCPEGYVNEPGTRFCLKKDEVEEGTESSTEDENRKLTFSF